MTQDLFSTTGIELQEAGFDPKTHEKTFQGSASEKIPNAPEGLKMDTWQGAQVIRELPHLYKMMPGDMTVGEALYKISTTAFADPRTDNAAGLMVGLGAPRSVRDARTGIVGHPFDMELALQMRVVNSFHATCLDKLAGMLWGRGFKNKKAKDLLDNVTEGGAAHYFGRVARSYLAVGQSYTELIKDSAGKIFLLDPMQPTHMSKVLPLPRRDVFYYLFHPHTCYEGYGHNRSFNYSVSDGGSSEQVAFALPGMKDRLARFLKTIDNPPVKANSIGEVAVLKSPTEMWDHYGCPQWIGAHPHLELSRIHLQRAHDYFYNRGTPDTITFFYGMQIPPGEQDKIKSYLSMGVGPGHGRSAAIFLPNTSVKTGKVQVEKFSDSINGNDLSDLEDTFARGVCAAHGVLPSIAGIQTAKSMGSANDILQAIVALQMLRTSGEQEMMRVFFMKNIQRGLRGAPSPEEDPNFFELEPIVSVDDSDLGKLNAMARQSESRLGPQASAGDAGLKRD